MVKEWLLFISVCNWIYSKTDGMTSPFSQHASCACQHIQFSRSICHQMPPSPYTQWLSIFRFPSNYSSEFIKFCELLQKFWAKIDQNCIDFFCNFTPMTPVFRSVTQWPPIRNKISVNPSLLYIESPPLVTSLIILNVQSYGWGWFFRSNFQTEICENVKF